MDIEAHAGQLGISTLDLFRKADAECHDPWYPNPDLNHTRWRLWGPAFVPDSMVRLLQKD